MHSFSGLSSGFSLCALRTARQRSWLPGSGGLRYPRNCGKLLVIEAAQHPPLAGSGVQHAPQQELEGSALNGTPSYFCFSMSCFNQGIVSIGRFSFVCLFVLYQLYIQAKKKASFNVRMSEAARYEADHIKCPAD